jgi:hypothetical protein
VKSGEQPARPASVSGGGAAFSVAKAYDGAYEAVLAYLKKQGQTIETESRDAGEILTGLTISGGRSQTGRRVQISMIKDGTSSTTVRVAVTVQTRKKPVQTEPWSDPKIDPKQSQLAADELKGILGT